MEGILNATRVAVGDVDNVFDNISQFLLAPVAIAEVSEPIISDTSSPINEPIVQVSVPVTVTSAENNALVEIMSKLKQRSVNNAIDGSSAVLDGVILSGHRDKKHSKKTRRNPKETSGSRNERLSTQRPY
mmetsp:Transcript_21291/g.25181  ORF Transcript_21291/g.25181 Transcript_21291/m.25181 type:complete len:130 (+) Transcript_21291:101-490(+)